MKYLNFFWNEKKGVGIVEYVLLLALLGTVIFVTVQPVQEQIGIMYDNQVNKEVVGSTNTESALRVELSTPSSGPVARPPSEQNSGPIVTTPDPVDPGTAPAQQNVSVELVKSTNDFDDEIIYDENGYYGTLTKKANGLSQEKVDEELTSETKDFEETIIKPTAEDFNELEQYEKTDPEGFSGTMTAVSGVRQVLTESGDPETVSKPSGIVTLSEESESTNTTYIHTLFPAQYEYTEVDSSNETATGYEGVLTKSGVLQSTPVRTVERTDTITHNLERFDTVYYDVTDSSTYITYELVSGATGTNPSNPNVYSDTFDYSINGKVGLLYFESAHSRPSGQAGVYEYYAVYSGYIFDKPTVQTDVFAPSFYHYDQNGYDGTVYLDMNSVKTRLTFFQIDNVYSGKVSQKVYSPGTFTSDVNTQTYPNRYNYDDGNGTTGSLSSPVKGTEYSHTDETGARYRHFATYTGNVYTKNYYAHYRYEAMYTGEGSKTITATVYRYDQPYSGTLYKDTYQFDYNYARDYAGTLFKTSTRDVFEYTQIYEGTVTEKR